MVPIMPLRFRFRVMAPALSLCSSLHLLSHAHCTHCSSSIPLCLPTASWVLVPVGGRTPNRFTSVYLAWSAKNLSFSGFLCFNRYVTARSVEDEPRNARWNAKQTPEWSSQVSFQTAQLKRNMNFDHRGNRVAFQRAFRVSSSTDRAAQRPVTDTCWHTKEPYKYTKEPYIYTTGMSKSIVVYWPQHEGVQCRTLYSLMFRRNKI